MMVSQSMGRESVKDNKSAGRIFYSNEMAVFFELVAAPTLKHSVAFHVPDVGKFRLMSGLFSLEDFINPNKKMALIAIFLKHFGPTLSFMLNTHDRAALKV